MRAVNFSVIACILLCTLHNGSSGLIGDALSQFFRIPKPNEFFELSKNAIFGNPSAIVFDIIQQSCSSALNSNTFSIKPMFPPNLGNIRFTLRTKSKNVVIPLANSIDLWTSPEFNWEWPLVIFVTGWNTNLKEGESRPQDAMADAYLCRGNVNFVTVDTDSFIDALYVWSALNSATIGEYISRALQKLVERYSPENVHLIGYSLGAQICGATGRLFNQKTGRRLRRITGLDPANPCFYNNEFPGLARGDAEWVDIIHTNPGVLGKKDAVGDCDFYPNGIDLPLQPGTFDITASHSRSWQYYAESVYPGNEGNFLAKQCQSIQQLNSRYCNGEQYPMGYAAPFNLKGNYFLRTNSRKPYGKNSRKYYQPICAN